MTKMTMKLFVPLLLVFIILFTFTLLNNKGHDNKQKNETKVRPRNSCPNILRKNGDKLSLSYSQYKGGKSVSFKNLDEYNSYHETQTRKGVKCPKLLLPQHPQNVYKFNPY